MHLFKGQDRYCRLVLFIIDIYGVVRYFFSKNNFTKFAISGIRNELPRQVLI
jgi:hypothetical protein